MNAVEYTVLRSGRKTLGLEITPEGKLLVRAPYGISDPDIQKAVARHRVWIRRHKTAVLARKAAHPEPSEEQRQELIRRARELLPRRTAYYSRLMGLVPAGITITGAKKRFGSCSAKNRLCFSWRLMLYPPEAIDYVVVHELAHIRHPNHQPEFYALVASVLPDWRQRQALLRK